MSQTIMLIYFLYKNYAFFDNYTIYLSIYLSIYQFLSIYLFIYLFI